MVFYVLSLTVITLVSLVSMCYVVTAFIGRFPVLRSRGGVAESKDSVSIGFRKGSKTEA